MPQQPRTSDEAFEAKLAELRARIDRLPPEQRPHLYDLAEAIARNRREIKAVRPDAHAAP